VQNYRKRAEEIFREERETVKQFCAYFLRVQNCFPKLTKTDLLVVAHVFHKFLMIYYFWPGNFMWWFENPIKYLVRMKNKLFKALWRVVEFLAVDYGCNRGYNPAFFEMEGKYTEETELVEQHEAEYQENENLSPFSGKQLALQLVKLAKSVKDCYLKKRELNLEQQEYSKVYDFLVYQVGLSRELAHSLYAANQGTVFTINERLLEKKKKF